MSDTQDRTLDCADCGGTFVFTAGEQAFYKERGFSDPKRCASCRAARKANRSGGSRYGGSQSGGYGGSQSGSYGGGGDRGGYRDRPQRQMHDVICADCGKPSQVPFEPREDRPVYCKDCYQRHRSW